MDIRDFLRIDGRDRPAIVAHRGESSRAPENTLEAGRLAREAGADAWEVDVQLSRDGVPIVLHDDSLARTTDVALRYDGDPRAASGFLAVDFDVAEIQTLDAGGWFLAETNGGSRTARDFGTLDQIDDAVRGRIASREIRVPTLVEVLRLTVELDWLINIELKSVPLRPAGLLNAVLRAVDECAAGDRVWLSSFDHDEAATAARWSGMPVGVLTSTPICRPARYVREWVGATAYHPSVASIGGESIDFRARPAPDSLRRRELKELRDAGVPVFVYTVNDVEQGGLADVLADAEVNGIFTDLATDLARRWKPAP